MRHTYDRHDKLILLDDNYIPEYFVSPNGVGYMPSSEIIKTKSFSDQMKACKEIKEKTKGNTEGM